MLIREAENPYTEVRVVARQFQDTQQARIRAENRYRSATKRDEHIDPSFTEPFLLMQQAEDMYGKILRKHYRQVVHPAIKAWVEATDGLGEHTMGRLLGEIGEPGIAFPAHWEENPEALWAKEGKRSIIFEEPFSRGVRQLWAYCGFGDPERRRRKGMAQEDALGLGNPLAKTLAWNIAADCIKLNGVPDKNGRRRARSPYRVYYEQTKKRFEAERDWTPGHIKNSCERLVAKAILKDLWRVVHGQEAVYGARTEWHPRKAA